MNGRKEREERAELKRKTRNKMKISASKNNRKDGTHEDGRDGFDTESPRGQYECMARVKPPEEKNGFSEEGKDFSSLIQHEPMVDKERSQAHRKVVLDETVKQKEKLVRKHTR